MAGKSAGYIIGGIEIVVGVLAEVFSLGILSEAAIPLIIAGVATIAATALTPAPPRQKTFRDSPTYGIDKFDNPRGPDAMVPVLYGTHVVKPVVISESVSSIAENNVPGVDAQTQQAVKWLGVVAEGVISDISGITINDVDVLTDLKTDVSIGTGNGSNKTFVLPHSWAYLGTDDVPAVVVKVAGVVKSYQVAHATTSFTVPSTGTSKVFNIVRDDHTDKVLDGTLRVFISGPGRPETEQLRSVGVYQWSAQRVAPWKLQIRFATRPPAGYVIRTTYDVLATSGLAIVQDRHGQTSVVFGTAPANHAAVTATYRVARFHGLKITWRPGTLDQLPIEGFTDTETSRNPPFQDLLVKNAVQTYTTDNRQVDDLRIGINAPRGLIQYDDSGGTNPVLLKIRIEYRIAGATSWTVLRSSAAGTEFGLLAERASTVRWEISVHDELEKLAITGDATAAAALAAFDREAYEVRVTRLTAASADTLVMDDLSFAYVTEVLREGFVYPGTCVLAIEAIASGQLNGQSLRVSCLATRAALYDPRAAGGSRNLGNSSNAALAIRDLVTSAEGVASERFGGGFFFTGADFLTGASGDLNGWTAFADFCDAWVHRPGDDPTTAPSATNGERRCVLNMVLDTPMSLMETVADMAFLGYCFASLQGALWRFPLDQDGDAAFTFIDDVDPPNQNMGKFVLKLDDWSKSPTGLRGSFWNERIRYGQDEMFYPVANLAPGTPMNVKDIDLRGCTRENEAARMLRHLAEQAHEMPFPCTWEAHPGVQHVEAGDIVTVKTRTPYSTGANATTLKVRVLAGMVGRDEKGKLTVKYAGRVMASSAYKLTAVTVPVTASSTSISAADTSRAVTGLTARVS